MRISRWFRRKIIVNKIPLVIAIANGILAVYKLDFHSKMGYFQRMKRRIKVTLPPVGLRIIKSVAAVLICYLISFIRGNSEIIYYSQIAALWCIQDYISNSRKNAVQRLEGTVIGALYGLFFLLMKERFPFEVRGEEHIISLLISGMVGVVLYTTVLIKRKEASYFSCTVFLSIVVSHMSDSNPYLFAWNRFLDTLIGVIVGIGVNSFALPKKKQRDILFISGLDSTLLHDKGHLSDYSKRELNRMLDEGANFTVSTRRTPASLMEPLSDIRLKLPVIAMDGAVLYDIEEKIYLRAYVISDAMGKEVLSLIQDEGLECFVNKIVDDMFVIYHREMKDEVQQKLISQLRRSPYRNYVKREVLDCEKVVYFMLLYPQQVIDDFYKVLEEKEITQKLKVLVCDAPDYPGYAYLKIYNKNATKENMSNYLKDILGLTEMVTFGDVPGSCDVLVDHGDSNKVVNELKKRFEIVQVRKL